MQSITARLLNMEKGLVFLSAPSSGGKTRLVKRIKELKGLIISDNPNLDKVNHPSHYTWLKDKCGIEVIDITRHMDFNLGNAIKYIFFNYGCVNYTFNHISCI